MARLDQLISFAFVEAGNAMFNKFDPELRRLKVKELTENYRIPPDFRKAKPAHVSAMIGAQAIGITVGNSIEASLHRWRELSNFIVQFQARHGRDAEVRIRRELAFEARDKTGISYRELAVLCAVLSCIGAKKYPVRITRQAIQSRMLGYKSPSVMQAEIAKRTDGAKPLTLRQINYTLDKLDERKFFSRARPNQRQTFYSVRLQQDQLENKLVEGKSYSQGFHERRRQRNAELIAKIKQSRTTIKADSSIIVDNGKEGCANDVHSASASVSTSVSTGASTLIQTPVIETPLIQTPSIETPENTASSVDCFQDGEEGKKTTQPPTLEEVHQLGASLHKQSTAEQVAEWYVLHGSDPQWTESDWRKPCAKWILDAISKANRMRKAVKLGQ